MRTHMPTSGDVTLERRSRLESMRSITEMLFPFHAFGFGSFVVISTWSASSQSRQSSTSTSMSIRVTIAQQWSLEHATTKSSFIWIHAMSLPVKAYGDCSSSACMRSSLTSLDFMSIFQTSRQSLGMQQTLKIFNKSLNAKEPRTQPSLPILKPMHSILKHGNCCTKTSHLNSSGIKQPSSGLQERKASLSHACTMLIQVQESASTSVLSSLLSKVLHLLRIFVVLMVVTLFPLPTFHAACLARGLLEDDNEWRQCLQEASHMATGHQLRNLFVTILRDCSPSDPLALWVGFRVHICDDLHHALHSHNIIPDPTQDQVSSS